MESGANILRTVIGGTDDDYEDEFEDAQQEDIIDGGGDCGGDQPPPPPHNDLDLDEIEGREEDVSPLLDTQKDDQYDDIKPALDRKPKLASSDGMPRLAGRRDQGTDGNRISGFHKRESRRSGGGQLLGGGSSGFGGYIG